MGVATWTAALVVAVLPIRSAAVATEEQAAAPAAADPAPRVVVSDGHVDISASETPVSELLALIASEAGVEVRGQVADPRPVTVEFEGVPIRRAVSRLVAGQSFTMRYGADGELRRITLRSVSVERPREGRRPARRVSFQVALRQHPKIRVTGLLAQQFAKTEVPITRLLAVVRSQPHGPLRTQAMTRFLREVERDRTLRQALREMSPAQLQQFLRQYGGVNAHDLARFLAGRAADPSVRRGAKAALRTLPRGRG